MDNLLSEEAHEQPSDNVKPSELVMELPDWYDEEQFNRYNTDVVFFSHELLSRDPHNCRALVCRKIGVYV